MEMLGKLWKAGAVGAMAAALGAAPSLALAADAPGADFARMLDLAKTRNCLACHGVERKVLGPSFKEVAQRYADRPGSADKLAAKVLKGGSGSWGLVPMPANTQVSEAEAAQLTACG